MFKTKKLPVCVICTEIFQRYNNFPHYVTVIMAAVTTAFYRVVKKWLSFQLLWQGHSFLSAYDSASSELMFMAKILTNSFLPELSIQWIGWILPYISCHKSMLLTKILPGTDWTDRAAFWAGLNHCSADTPGDVWYAMRIHILPGTGWTDMAAFCRQFELDSTIAALMLLVMFGMQCGYNRLNLCNRNKCYRLMEMKNQ